ncbi:NADP oxidoreductase [Ketobacter sp.]|uniref:NADH-quinone oxidoreductase subunit B family protein n=1 Tax=Ketobacter sp. TaxID=2083498 RepID=UPI000F1DA8A1|nr:NADP oxidoreductase [Ketobacter sp.]MEE2732828.1 NADP oxidoreductase [Pseudomonadota bacterium]RLU01541.1 MAG: NADP oxidoreductase [Ketobacter sp.]
MTTKKVRVATCSLAGCFGCHMSFLDMDEALIPLLDHIEFDRSPLTDIKTATRCDIGLIEGGLCNEENKEVLHQFREQCTYLVAVGACAINGGVPAMRNHLSVQACLEESYLDGLGVVDAQIPNDPELPALLPKVLPLQAEVAIDFFLPGCPPPAAAFLELVQAVLEQRAPNLDYASRRFD